MNQWFLYFLKRSVSERKGRFIISATAVMLTVSVVTALATLSLGVRDKIGIELKQYGANMIITDRAGKELDLSVANGIVAMKEYVKGASFQIYGSAQVKNAALEVVGAEPAKMTGYRLYGTLPQASDEVMVGVNLKDVLKVKQGDVLRFDGRPGDFRVTALFEKGSDEDATLVMPIEGARKLLGVAGVSAILLNADTKLLPEAEAAFVRSYPFLLVKTLRQVAVAEERILSRIQLLMLLVTGVVLFSSIIALGSTMGANVIERMEEIGVMKSLGATRKHIRDFFMSEAASAGLVGALAGYLAGIVSAEVVSRTAFGSFIPVNIVVAPLAVLLGVSISILATYLPVRDAMKVVPAQILRGE
jgi:putative ABC transport system permease protein